MKWLRECTWSLTISPRTEETKAAEPEAEKPKERKKYNVFETFPVQRRRGPAPRKMQGKMIHLSKAAMNTDKGIKIYRKTYRKADKEKTKLEIIKGKTPEEMKKVAEQAEKSKEVCDVVDCQNPVLQNGLCISHDDDDF